MRPAFIENVLPIEQNYRNNNIISRILQLSKSQRWSGDGMRKWEVIFSRALTTQEQTANLRILEQVVAGTGHSDLSRDQDVADVGKCQTLLGILLNH